jgi:lipopolysaccharide heptosyltransferase I
MQPSNILLVRLSAIGDVIHTMPVACALMDRFPDARLTWVVEQRAAALLRGHRAIAELIALPHGFLKSPLGVWRLRRHLRQQRFDLAIDAQGLTKSALVAWLSGARRRIGFGNPWGRELSTWLNRERVDTTRPHAVERNLELLRPLGIDAPRVHFDVPALPGDEATARALVDQSPWQAGFALMTAGAGWPSKLWPLERFAAVARHLMKQWRLATMIVCGNAAERQRAEQIEYISAGAAHVAPAMSLAELAAVMRRARLVVGCDTGPLHLAAAVGTACVGLYGPWPAEGHGPYGPQHIAVQKAFLDGSTRQRRRASAQFMEAIGVEMVVEACDTILSRGATAAA